jgi:hypothetical protein
MLKGFLITMGFGVLWLFLLSIPVSKSQRLFDIAFNVFVDTPPLNWAVGKVQGYLDMTRDMPPVESRIRGHESGDYAQGTSRKH